MWKILRKDVDFFLRSVPISYKKGEKVIKLYRNSEKLYEKFREKFSLRT